MKKILIIVIIITSFILLTYKFKLNTDPMKQFIEATKKLRSVFPREICENAERIFRLETAHFKSGQFLGTFSPGMEKFSNTYPYGWISLKKLVWDKHPEYRPIGLKTFTENGTGKQKTFIVFPSVEASLFTLCEFLKAHNNNAGRWFSLDASLQAGYNQKIAKIQPKINYAIA